MTIVRHSILTLSFVTVGAWTSTSAGDESGLPSQQEAEAFLRDRADQFHIDKDGNVIAVSLAKYGTEFTDDDICHLLAHPKLQWLSIRDTDVSVVGIHRLVELKELRCIDMPKDVPAEGISLLRETKHLHSLLLEASDLTTNHLQAIASLEQLGSVHIVWPTNFDDRELSVFSKMPNLTHINVPASITGDGLATLAQCAKLRTLSMRRCTKLGDKDLQYLARFKAVEKIELPPTITDAAIPYITQCQRRLFLCIAVTKISDEGLAALSSMSNLKVVMLPPGTTDEGVEHFAGHPNLTNIIIFGDRISEDMVSKIESSRPKGRTTVTRLAYRRR